jgi:hypothetical protein
MICLSHFFAFWLFFKPRTVGGSNTPDECSLTNLREEDMVETKVLVQVSS